MGSGLTIQVRLERETYTPGALIRGVVIATCKESVTLNSMNAVFVQQLGQRWQTSSGSGKHRRTHTHVVRTPINKQVIPLTQGGVVNLNAGTTEYPFAFGLSGTALPSVPAIRSGSSWLWLESKIAVEADVRNGFNRSGDHAITVLSPVPAQMHQQGFPRNAREEHEVVCCGCCCSRGKLTQEVYIDRSIIALDRDKVNFGCRVTNTSDSDVDSVTVSLTVSTVPKVGATHVRPSQVVSTVSVPLHAPAKGGEPVEATGTLPMNALAAPSINSSVLDVVHSISIAADTCCCLSDPTCVLRPVQIGSFVDTSAFAAQAQQAYQTQQVMDPNSFDSCGSGQQTQNLYFQQQGGQPAIPQWQPQQQQQQYGGQPPQFGGHQQPQYGQQPPPPPHYGAPPSEDYGGQSYGAPAGPDGSNLAFGAFAPPPPMMFEQQAHQQPRGEELRE